MTAACGQTGGAETVGSETGSGDGGLTQITVAVSALSPPAAPLWLAEDQGIYDEHGLDVNLISLEGGSLTAQGLRASAKS